MSLVNVVIPPLAARYTYTLPAALSENVSVGFEVDVPLGRRTAVGYVVETPSVSPLDPGIELKAIAGVRRRHPLFLPSQLGFFQWVADYYGDSLANVIEAAVPPPVPQKYQQSARLSGVPIPALKGRTEQQILELLKTEPQGVDVGLLRSRFKGAGAIIKRLKERGLITVREEEILDQHLLSSAAPDWAKREVQLTEAQRTALRSIVDAFTAQQFCPILLHGVTGSGKTEVYIEAAREVIAQGRGVLVIVPEIALTPQLIDRFRARLGNSTAVLHSGLHPRVRWDGWRALLEGRALLGIGARSAIFAPIENVGLIIVDEEHDTSYKQQEGLRYQARDLALVRGKLHRCPVVLGSATPSLESFHNSAKQRYQYLELPTRPGSISFPSISVVDLNRVKPWEMKSRSVSPALFEALDRTINEGSQSFILYNRRGFASYLQCESCEEVVQCPNCSVTLTLHKNSNSLVCHYCGTRSVPPQCCPSCSQATKDKPASVNPLVLRGSGTERVYDELRELFPNTVIDRLDRDVVQDGEHYRRILDRVRDGTTSILVGTQMIAKGHDLPGVTLVGVVDCDVGLHMPDFRAGERVFQLLTQVAGRAGRADKPGEVILQTRVPKHPSIIFTEQHAYRKFAEHELSTRQALHYPPFVRMLRVVVSSSDRSLGGAFLDELMNALEILKAREQFDCLVLGPSPAPIEKIKTLWRWHALIKSSSSVVLNRIVRFLQPEKARNKNIRLVWDIDPQEML